MITWIEILLGVGLGIILCFILYCTLIILWIYLGWCVELDNYRDEQI